MNNRKTNFGKLKINKNQKTKKVQDIFTKVSKKYDLMNDIMSFGTHRIWKNILINKINIQKNDKIIDVGSGTGDLIKMIHKKYPDTKITSADLNESMLMYNQQHFQGLSKNINWVNCNAENLPFEDNTFDKYITAFCIRNVTLIDKAIYEAKRVLKCGGSFYCLEFSTPQNLTIKNIYDLYKSRIIPLIGDRITKNKKAYTYLEESITHFPSQEELLDKIKKIGFVNTSYINLFNGIVAIHIGYKI